MQILSTSIASLTTSLGSIPSPGVSGGYETFDDAKTNFTEVYENITNIYEKIQHNRDNIKTKCTKVKCDKILNKVKKVKMSVDFLQNTNITVLEQMVEMLKNTTLVSSILELQTNVTTLQSDVENLKSNVSTLSTATTSNTASINSLGMLYKQLPRVQIIIFFLRKLLW